MAEEAKRQGKRLMGQLAAETEHDDLNIMFAGYGNADCYCWFIELSNFVLIAHVDDRWKTLGIVPIQHAADFQSLVNETANGLNIKHHYPVEFPADFLKEDENKDNPPDKDNV